MDELNTYSFSPQSQYFEGQKQMALDQCSKRLESASQPDCQNLQSTSRT